MSTACSTVEMTAESGSPIHMFEVPFSFSRSDISSSYDG